MSRSMRPLSGAALAVSVALLLPVAALADSSVGQRAFNPQPEPPKGKVETKPGTGQVSGKGIIIVITKAQESTK